MARRRNGTGAVKRRLDGRWEPLHSQLASRAGCGRRSVQLRLADGSRKYLYARARDQLLVRLREERWRLAWGIPISTKGLRLAEYVEQWLDIIKARVRPRTFEAYEVSLRRLMESLGGVPVARLTPQLIQRTYGDLLASGLSPRTVLHTHAVLHRALKQARHWGLVTTVPTELVATPRGASRDERPNCGAAGRSLREQPRRSRLSNEAARTMDRVLALSS